ncbi:MAG TPA: hypothetical protein VHN80_01530 [Kineosporiaceae bacterium]|nr:hypothetical protein [Kineosporiaceae bacterium]
MSVCFERVESLGDLERTAARRLWPAAPAVRIEDPRLSDPHDEGDRPALAFHEVAKGLDGDRRVAYRDDLRIVELRGCPPEPVGVGCNIGGPINDLATM